ncbi:transposase family protein [Streptomyces sp. TRM66268-LWL]|uniref:Transposase family protein n=1 Tax=Streptomyces polyasparticus TaxID=2767826 RepID=A0ABR7SW36_9ACTN|nr:DDE-type integrase/transposase/recombinase [Streptomyces polyasparticus]MBC9718855.1 transposase family protein [Streptomyces polyasparticus]
MTADSSSPDRGAEEHGSPAAESAGHGSRQAARESDLKEKDFERAQIRLAHLLEVETGYRSGSPFWAAPGEPRPAYDPDATTLTERRLAKVAELNALAPQDAKTLGLGAISFRTLERMAAAHRAEGLLGLADGRWTRRRSGHRSITEPVAEALKAVHAESLHRSKLSMRTRERMIHQYVREKYGPDVKIPHYTTLAGVWREWFGSNAPRQKYLRSAAAVDTGWGRVAISRPGQVVLLDTTPLSVKVLDDVFGEPISVDLTLALDAYTHSLVAFRLTPVADASIEVAMLLRDVLCPLPMRRDWGEEMAWHYPGVPQALVTELAGHPVAARPFFAPETITSDHGSVYKNHHLIQVSRRLGVDVLPARVMRPQDKAACERAFAGIQSLLLELLLGYQGIDTADRGADPEGDATWTLSEMEHLLATWIVRVWQNRALDQYAPAWDPGGTHSPNTLFATAAAREGISLQVPEPELYFELLPVSYVKIHGRRGVKIGGLWYGRDAAVLDPYRSRLSARGGMHQGKWAISRDPRDARQVYFEDPATGDWHTLAWNGLPPGQDIPAFGDARVKAVLQEAARAGLKPKDDTELLPVLLDLIARHTPVEVWPTQLSKKQRVERARELARARAAATDRPAQPVPSQSTPVPQGPAPVLRPVEIVEQTRSALAAQRRQRREQALSDRPKPAPLLADTVRAQNLFLLPAQDSHPNNADAEDEDEGGELA